ncbi:hypothetical protein B296_00001082 [Ensete ventricosum]|uniref:Uncharacterized protein n=1 Tax=Ensete ventricosum TaxID=4639 RepID=A0A427AVM6_ENSVE|nr:hypothetical protein B296_00001082 [Ensete ventricosum]
MRLNYVELLYAFVAAISSEGSAAYRRGAATYELASCIGGQPPARVVAHDQASCRGGRVAARLRQGSSTGATTNIGNACGHNTREQLPTGRSALACKSGACGQRWLSEKVSPARMSYRSRIMTTTRGQRRLPVATTHRR